MSVTIVERLHSNPQAVRFGQQATLSLGLQSDQPEGETVTVEYRLGPGNDVLFEENGAKLIAKEFEVASELTPTQRTYALQGPRAGKIVTITALVQAQKSKEAVTILE